MVFFFILINKKWIKCWNWVIYVINKSYFLRLLNLDKKLINIRDKINKKYDLIAYSKDIQSLEREITLFHANIVNEIINKSKVEFERKAFIWPSTRLSIRKFSTKRQTKSGLLRQSRGTLVHQKLQAPISSEPVGKVWVATGKKKRRQSHVEW